jgi:hypothetical protein
MARKFPPMKPLPLPPPEEPSTDNVHLLELDIVWSTLVSQLIGETRHDAAIIASFCEAAQIPARAVIAKLKMHFGFGNETVH